MTTSVKESPIATVTSWNSPELYAKKKRAIAATALKALTLSIINPWFVETWDEVVNGEVIRYSMSRCEIIKNFGWVLFDKVVNKKKALTNEPSASVEKEITPEERPVPFSEEGPLDHLLPFLDSPSNSQVTHCKEETAGDYLLHFGFNTIEEEVKTTPKPIETSDKEITEAWDWYVGTPHKPVASKGPEDSGLLELFLI